MACTYPSIHFSLDEDTLEITVGCPLCLYPSIHKKTLKITVGCPLCTYPSIHFSLDEDTLKTTVGCLWSTYPSVRGLWARPPVLLPVPVPSQAIHSRTGWNLHYSDIQSTAQKSPCVNTFFEAIAFTTHQKKLSCNQGNNCRTYNEDTQHEDNGTRERDRCDDSHA